MAELQRSVTTFRRSGSSGLVWDERLFSSDDGDPNQTKEKKEVEDEGAAAAEFRELRHSKSVGSIGMMARSRSTCGGGGRHAAFRSTVVPPAADPPSPEIPRCCAFFGKHRPAKTTTASKPRPPAVIN